MADKVLVTGGAGYIGAHACKALARAGFIPVVFDNLSTGWAEAVKWGPLVKGDLMDRASIDAALAEHRPVAVMHFAALSLVGEAMQDPARYWRENVGGALNLLGGLRCGGGAECRPVLDLRDLWRSGWRPSDRRHAAAPDQCLWRVEAGGGGNAEGFRHRLRDRPCHLPLFQRRRCRPGGRDRRAAPAGDSPHSADAGCGGGQAAGADGLWHRLSDARTAPVCATMCM